MDVRVAAPRPPKDANTGAGRKEPVPTERPGPAIVANYCTMGVVMSAVISDAESARL